VRAGAPAAALFLAVVAGLYFDEVRPQIEDRVYRGSDGRPFHLPTYLPGDCPFYRATALSLLREKDLDLHDDMAWNVVRPQGQVALGARTIILDVPASLEELEHIGVVCERAAARVTP